jgi:hypothetical protein
MAEKSIFDVLGAISNKTPIKFDKKLMNPWMLSLWISHNSRFIDIVNKINPLISELPPELVFKYYMEIIPKGRHFFKWIKGEGKKKTKEFEKDVQELMDIYKISKKRAEETLLTQGD